MKISFMTWACPDWPLEQVLKAAAEYGYEGVELRVEADQAHGVDLHLSEGERARVRRMFADAGLEVACIATSRRFALREASEVAESVELTRRYVDLAADLGCQCVRVFGGSTPAGVHFEQAQRIVADALGELGPYAAERGVWVCLETHDDYSRADVCRQTVDMAGAPGVGIVWDMMHPCRWGMTIEEAFEHVAQHVRHCHVHDGVPEEPGSTKWRLAKMGEGQIPHDRAVALLGRIGFSGFLSGEHIRFLPPEELLPHEARMLKEYIARAGVQ